jgi:hypothetical protein
MMEIDRLDRPEVNQPLTGIVSNGSACLRWLAGIRRT